MTRKTAAFRRLSVLFPLIPAALAACGGSTDDPQAPPAPRCTLALPADTSERALSAAIESAVQMCTDPCGIGRPTEDQCALPELSARTRAQVGTRVSRNLRAAATSKSIDLVQIDHGRDFVRAVFRVSQTSTSSVQALGASSAH